MRSAWIEIKKTGKDYNINMSRSMRSAWIEIQQADRRMKQKLVALHAERVD